MPFELTRLAVTGWLLTLSLIDLRRHQLPHALTTLPVLACALWFLVQLLTTGSANALAGLLVFGAVVFSDTWLAVLPALAGLVVACMLGTPSGQTLVLAWLLSLAAAQAGIMGAGDAKVIMVLLTIYPDPRLGLALLAVTGLAGLIGMLAQARTATGFWLLSLARDLVALKPPARTGETGTLHWPLVPVLTLGALVYLWGTL